MNFFYRAGFFLFFLAFTSNLSWANTPSSAQVAKSLYSDSGQNKLLLRQRRQFQQARKALNAKKWSQYRGLKKKLQSYPLFLYLEYWELRQSTGKGTTTKVRTFLDRYPDTLAATKIRSRWLKQLAKEGQWTTYQKLYRKTKNVDQRCHYLRSLIATGKKKKAWEQVPSLWHSGKSQPKACDPVFAAWYKAGGLTEKRVWERIALAMEKGNIGLTRYLERFLPALDRPWAAFWRQIHGSPSHLVAHKLIAKPHSYKEAIIGHGLRRMAKKDPLQAFAIWEKIHSRYLLSSEQQQRTEGTISMRLIYKKPAGLLGYLQQLPTAAKNLTAGAWRIRVALRQQNWSKVLAWIEALPKEQKVKERWIYWQARALQALGQSKKAQPLYQGLALERTFYGFLAADRINQPYCLYDQPVNATPKQYRKINQLPGLQRVREFYAMGDLLNARREWYHLFQRLDLSQQRIAAKIAQSWGWFDRAIFALARTNYWNDLELRFPIAHRKLVQQYAKQNNLEPAWVYAVLRQESAFMTDATSRVGARGLMQLMPATARRMAKKTGVALRKNKQLFSPNLNIRLGTAYQRTVLNNLDNRIVLATAAYNAGPHNVRKWLPKGRTLPADIWVETIPFKETRSYVRRVLSYTIFYEYRLGTKMHTLSSRLLPITEI